MRKERRNPRSLFKGKGRARDGAIWFLHDERTSNSVRGGENCECAGS